MSSVIDSLEQRAVRKRPRFDPGDRVKVHFQVIEGQRRRTQIFEGIVIRRQGSGARETFTVRKHSFGVGVERTFPVHSPKIETLEVAGRGRVRRAKLYYLRDKLGKQARVAERRWGIEDELVVGDAEGEALDSEGVSVTEAAAEVAEPEVEEGAEGEEAPAEEAPAVEEAPAEEAPADEAPAEEPPAEEAPAAEAEPDEAAADEPAAEDKASD